MALWRRCWFIAKATINCVLKGGYDLKALGVGIEHENQHLI